MFIVYIQRTALSVAIQLHLQKLLAINGLLPSCNSHLNDGEVWVDGIGITLPINNYQTFSIITKI